MNDGPLFSRSRPERFLTIKLCLGQVQKPPAEPLAAFGKAVAVTPPFPRRHRWAPRLPTDGVRPLSPAVDGVDSGPLGDSRHSRGEIQPVVIERPSRANGVLAVRVSRFPECDRVVLPQRALGAERRRSRTAIASNGNR